MKQLTGPVFLLLALAAAPAATAGVQAGKWQLIVDVSLAQGAAPAGPIVETRCISEAEAAHPEQLLAQTGHERCVFSEARDTGAEYTFSVACQGGPVPITGHGLVRYTADTLDGTIDLVVEQSNLKITTHSKVRGRRLGSCNS